MITVSVTSKIRLDLNVDAVLSIMINSIVIPLDKVMSVTDYIERTASNNHTLLLLPCPVH